MIIPQAMRVIIPPTDQRISEPHQELVAGRRHRAIPSWSSIFTGTALNQTGRAIEIIGMTMAGLSDPLAAHLGRS